MRILITGSSGQLGRAIVSQLAAQHTIVGLDSVAGSGTDNVGSITDHDLVFRLMAGVDAVIHIASLHAPHLATRSKQDFIDTNISGTLNLLEAAQQAGVRRFVYTSTTSVYGFALVPKDRAVWVSEELAPQPRDMYDITKLTAEQLCRHFALTANLPTIILRTGRFFAEAPKREAIHRLSRGADVRDVAAAHVLAVTNSEIDFDIFNISARSPFRESDLDELLTNGAAVVRRYYPDIDDVFTQQGWTLPNSIDRVYVIEHAERRLGYNPAHNFPQYLQQIGAAAPR